MIHQQNMDNQRAAGTAGCQCLRVARLVQVSYLSTAPEALSEVLLTGGLPPGLTQPCSAEAAYMSLYRCSLVSGRSRCS